MELSYEKNTANERMKYLKSFIFRWKRSIERDRLGEREKRKDKIHSTTISCLFIWIRNKASMSSKSFWGSSRSTKWMRHSLSFFISLNHAYTNWWIMISSSMCEILFYPFRTYYTYWSRTNRGRWTKYKTNYDEMYKSWWK